LVRKAVDVCAGRRVQDDDITRLAAVRSISLFERCCATTFFTRGPTITMLTKCPSSGPIGRAMGSV
jgi:hypothetical protein